MFARNQARRPCINYRVAAKLSRQTWWTVLWQLTSTLNQPIKAAMGCFPSPCRRAQPAARGCRRSPILCPIAADAQEAAVDFKVSHWPGIGVYQRFSPQPWQQLKPEAVGGLTGSRGALSTCARFTEKRWGGNRPIFARAVAISASGAALLVSGPGWCLLAFVSGTARRHWLSDRGANYVFHLAAAASRPEYEKHWPTRGNFLGVSWQAALSD